MATTSTTLRRAARRRPHPPLTGRASFPEIYFVKHIDNSRLRREVDPEKSRDCLSLLGLAILIFVFGLLFATQHFRCVRLGYQIEQLKAQRAAMRDWNHQLRLEHASLADPQRIDTLARTRLGLASPQPEQVILLGRTGSAFPARAQAPEFARNFAGSSRQSAGGQ